MDASFSALQKTMKQQLQSLEMQCTDIIDALKAENMALRASLSESNHWHSSKLPYLGTSSPSQPKRLPAPKDDSCLRSKQVASLDDLMHDAVVQSHWSSDDGPNGNSQPCNEPEIPASNEIAGDNVQGTSRDVESKRPASFINPVYSSGPCQSSLTSAATLEERTISMLAGQERINSITTERKSVLHSQRSPLEERTTGAMLQRKEFDMVISFLLVVNCLVLSIEAQYYGLRLGSHLAYPGFKIASEDIWPGAQKTFDVFDWFFGIIFAVELLLKLVFLRCKFFFQVPTDSLKYLGLPKTSVGGRLLGAVRSIQGWNWLDFLCVVAFLIDKLIQPGAIKAQRIRLLRLVRLWRVVRLLRYFETADHLYVMTTTISSLGKVLTWAIALLTTMLLLCNLLLVQALHGTYFNSDFERDTDLTKDQLRKRHEVYEHFGTCSRGMLSMFEITLGNWPPIARLLSEEVSEWFTLVCLIHKLTIGFAVIGVITGVVLQETFKVAHTDDVIMYRQKARASVVLRQKMQALFDVVDDSGDGVITLDEFVAIGDNEEMKIWLASLDIETDDLPLLFALIDAEDKKYITLDELVKRMPRIKGAARGIDMLAMRKHIRIGAG